MDLTFDNPVYLWLLWSIPLLIITHFILLRRTRKKAVKFANFEALKRIAGKKILTKNLFQLFLRILILLLLILSASGAVFWYEGYAHDFNVVLAIDSSGSMLADDFLPNRLEAAKQSARLFLDLLTGSTKVGIVSFSGMAYIDQRLTSSRGDAREAIEKIEIKPTHGTAIGDALKASTQLLAVEEKPKMIILLTDGQENIAKKIEFNRVVDMVENEHITVYTIGMGTSTGGEGVLPPSMTDELLDFNVQFTLDEDTLVYIANQTDGAYFKADNKDEVYSAYEDIAAKKNEAKIPVRLSYGLLVVALMLIFIEWGLLSTKYRLLP